MGVRIPATRRRPLALLALTAGLAVASIAPEAGCAGRATKPSGETGGAASMQLTSPAFEDGDRMPERFAGSRAGGGDVSPPLRWSGAPEGTRSFALVVIDRHPIARGFVHWAVVDIPAGTTSLPEEASGSLPAGRELQATSGRQGWSGPTPPPGSGPHPYEFTIHALSVERADVPRQPTEAAFSSAIEGDVLASGSLTVYAER